MAPFILDWVVLEDLKSILRILSKSPSNIDFLSHHNSLCLGPSYWHISALLPLQFGLGVEELGLEGVNNVNS